jgi:4-hydroxy-2-oxoheptanedioate aldolase
MRENQIRMIYDQNQTSLGQPRRTLSVEGLDAIFIGPSDLSLALGCTPHSMMSISRSPKRSTISLASAKSHGLVAGIHHGTPEYALKRIEKGFQFVTIGSDARLMAARAQHVLAKMRAGAPKPSSGAGG